MVRGKIVMKNERNVQLSDKTRVENVCGLFATRTITTKIRVKVVFPGFIWVKTLNF